MDPDAADIEFAIEAAIQLRHRLGVVGDISEAFMMHPRHTLELDAELGTAIGTLFAHIRQTVDRLRQAETHAERIDNVTRGILNVVHDVKQIKMTYKEIDDYVSQYHLPPNMTTDEYKARALDMFLKERIQPLGVAVQNLASKLNINLGAIQNRVQHSLETGLSKVVPPFVGQMAVASIESPKGVTEGGEVMPDDIPASAWRNSPSAWREDPQNPEVRKIMGLPPLEKPTTDPSTGAPIMPEIGDDVGGWDAYFARLKQFEAQKKAAQQAAEGGEMPSSINIGDPSSADPAFDQFISFQRAVMNSPADSPRHWEEDLYPENYAQVHPSELGFTQSVFPFHHPTVAGVVAMNCLSHSGNEEEAKLTSLEPAVRMQVATAGIPSAIPIQKIPMDLDELEVRSKGQVNNRLIGCSPIALGVVTSAGYSEVIKPSMSDVDKQLLNTINVNEDMELTRSTMTLNLFNISKEGE